MENESENKKEDEKEGKIDSLSLIFQCDLGQQFTGTLTSLVEGKAEIQFKPTKEMVIDDNGLVHSSFILTACEYASLVVTNKENLFVQSVEAEYLAPIEVGMECIIKASIKYNGDKKNIIIVQAFHKDIKVFDGTFNILELEQHILQIKLNEQME